MGSTFAVELPIYSRSADRFYEAPEDIESSVSVASRARPQPRPIATNIVQVLPTSHTISEEEEVTSHQDPTTTTITTTIIGRVVKKLTVLIVDDSSANRSDARRFPREIDRGRYSFITSVSTTHHACVDDILGRLCGGCWRAVRTRLS